MTRFTKSQLKELERMDKMREKIITMQEEIQKEIQKENTAQQN